jgi:predicted transcriptional regulator
MKRNQTQIRTYLNAVERMVTMCIDHTIMAMHQAPQKTVLTFVFAWIFSAGGTEIVLKKVTMTIMTKQFVEAILAILQPFN